MSDTPNVFQAMNAVAKDLAAVGIGKVQENKHDRYNFRGIDDVFNVVGPILAKHGLVIAPVMVTDKTERATTSGGKPTMHTQLVVNYTVYGPDGTSIICTVPGESMDRGDKSQNKAMSAAYKNCLFQLFCIPVLGQDSEEESHEVDDCISEEQLAEIVRLFAIVDNNPDLIGRVTRFAGVNALSEIKANQYDQIHGMLTNTVNKHLDKEEANDDTDTGS